MMTRISGTVEDKAQKENKNGDPFLAFKIGIGRQYPVSVTDHEMRGEMLHKGDRVELDIEESQGTYNGKAVTYRNLIAVMNRADDEDDGPDLTDAEYEVPAITPQETRSGPVEPAFNGMAWGACQNNATTIVTSADYIKPSFLSEEEKRSWYTGEILTLALLMYQQRPS
tara:strand:- start:68 stop:574 length:507 start_codon:yes stop_codon:yes gene_type:complete